jgi:chemotaxis protein MotB
MRRLRAGRDLRREEHAPTHDRWLLSYADFVTLLLAVFIVLFAFSRIQEQSAKAVSVGIHAGFEELGLNLPSRRPSISSQTVRANAPQTGVSSPLPLDALQLKDTLQLKKQLEQVIGEAIDKHEIVIQQTSEGLIISLRDFGFFNSGEATLLPGAAAQLERTARVLIEHNLEIRVEGHSDDQPIHTEMFESNWELSTARATSVLNLLLNDAGFPPSRISVAGYGPYRPVADNATPEGRRMNRRVDLVIIEPKQTATMSQDK